MPFPEALAQAQRSALGQDIKVAYDLVEKIYHDLNDEPAARPHLFDLQAGEFQSVKEMVDTAYNSLSKAKKTIETSRNSKN